jgi:hypothetical protein
MDAGTFGLIVSLIGLVVIIICVAVPIWILFLAVRWLIRQINKTYKEIMNFGK